MTFSLKMQGTSITLSFLCSYSHKISSLLISLFSEFHYTTRVSGSYFPWYCLGPVGRYCSNLSADHRSPVISLSDTGPRSIENSDSLSLPFLGCLREVGRGEIMQLSFFHACNNCVCLAHVLSIITMRATNFWRMPLLINNVVHVMPLAIY